MVKVKAMPDESMFAIGDYVTVDYDESRGIIYMVTRIIERDKNHTDQQYVMKPVFCLFCDNNDLGFRRLPYSFLKKLTLVDTGVEFQRFADLIKKVARHDAGLRQAKPKRSRGAHR